ncbi:MAG: Beta-N-acetylhexosaminidase [Actinobacteria bacterium]|nr:Beta-N-acetylhexosaminidase [Actinomycetota bacterium]
MDRNRKKDPAFPFLMAGFEGKSLPPRLAAWLRDGNAAGVVLFSRNLEGPKQVKELCREIRAAAGKSRLAPLIAIDQEGGRVTRLKDPGFTQFPPARSYSLFCCHAERAAEAAGAAIALELSSVGINVNFAPVLDVDSNPKNPVIGDRALGSDPETVARLGIAFQRGSQYGGVIPVGKHFPGHGHTDADSHEELPVVRSSRGTLLGREVLPFRRAVSAGVPALMTAHVLYPSLDPEYPATLSRKILTGLLRKKLRFHGVLFSDALEMKAVSLGFGIGHAAVMAILAGCDAVLVCRGEKYQSEAIEAVAREWRDTPGFRRVAAQAARRVARLRARAAAQAGNRASLRSAGAKGHRELAALLWERWESNGRTSETYISNNIGEH